MGTQTIRTKAELARALGVSRSYITLISQGKRKPSQEMANRLTQLGLTVSLSEFGHATRSGMQGAELSKTEHLTFNQGVTGSRPVRPTSNFPLFNTPCLFCFLFSFFYYYPMPLVHTIERAFANNLHRQDFRVEYIYI